MKKHPYQMHDIARNTYIFYRSLPQNPELCLIGSVDAVENQEIQRVLESIEPPWDRELADILSEDALTMNIMPTIHKLAHLRAARRADVNVNFGKYTFLPLSVVIDMIEHDPMVDFSTKIRDVAEIREFAIQDKQNMMNWIEATNQLHKKATLFEKIRAKVSGFFKCTAKITA